MTEVLRLLLAAVFAVAGAAKLLDREGSRRAARAFGAPGWIGVALPVVELAIAVALVPSSTARAAALAGAALLTVFSVAIANALLRGRKPDCGCFGRLHSAPAGWGTVARNASLAVLALAIASQPAGALSWVEVAVAGVAIALVAQAIVGVTLLRRYGRALRRIEELEASATAPLETVAPAPGTSPAPNGAPRVATAAAFAGGLAVTTAAHASRSSHQVIDPELKAIEDALGVGGQRLLAAAERSRKAIRAQAVLLTGKKAREKRKAARRAIAAERREVLGLRTTIDRLAESSTRAHNVKAIVHNSLTLHALSLQRRERAIGAEPKVARRLVNEAQQIFLRSLGSLAAAGALLKAGK